MPIDFIQTQADLNNKPIVSAIIKSIIDSGNDLDGVVYYRWPQLKDYNDEINRADIALITRGGGVKLVAIVASGDQQAVDERYREIAQIGALVEAQLTKSTKLRVNRKLILEVEPVLFAPNYDGDLDGSEATFVSSEARFISIVLHQNTTQLSVEELDEVRSILEGAKALARPKPRNVREELGEDVGASYARLEEVIANFDAKQRGVAMTGLQCPQRIRGLAGTGKTVILAMKAAITHIQNPEHNILVTYYTRSLKNTIERLIVRFYRHFAEGEPNWERIHVRHGWGRRSLPGVYRDACLRSGVSPLNYSNAQSQRDPFDFVCKTLLKTSSVEAFYDAILIVEGQDFPDGFYKLCFFLAKGGRDCKQIIWAYDELQNVFDVKVRSPDVLFGEDDDGQPRISLTRSLPEGAETNDHVLQRSYRNQREVLVLAHAIGFGVYGQIVQMLENRQHWQDVGYDIVSGDFAVGSKIVVERPKRNSPSELSTPVDVPMIARAAFGSIDEEVTACVNEVKMFIKRGLRPHDIMIITLDDRSARTYLSRASRALALEGIGPNNLLADAFDEPPFSIEDHVTLSTVYRAKGNEAAVVFVLGADAATLSTRTGRNRLFVALTRTKGWLRVSGFDIKRYSKLVREIDLALAAIPKIEFLMPDMNELNTIQRDLEEKYARMLEAKSRIQKLQSELNLSEDDMSAIISGDDIG